MYIQYQSDDTIFISGDAIRKEVRMPVKKLLLIVGLCFLPVFGQTIYPLTTMVSENGYISLSLDALGTNDSAGAYIQVNKPNNATVKSAYLIGTADKSRTLFDGDIAIHGSGVVWLHHITWNNVYWSHWADVTSIIKPEIDASPTGLINLLIDEKDVDAIDGVILAVIFNDPNQTQRNTVILFFGHQNTAGDDFYIKYAEPINLSEPNLRLDFSLGISNSAQEEPAASYAYQYSIIDVNGKRLTTSAGGEDDGFSRAGALITVGGIGDSNSNPVDPNATPSNCRSDDELYSLIPFVAQGDTQTHIHSRSSTGNNGNVSFAALFSSITSIVGEGILLTPVEDANLVGTFDTLIAKVQSNSGAPVIGQRVTFEIVNGPHAGVKDSSVTNGSGNALFIYKGSASGQDEIVASMRGSTDGLVFSNHAYHYWKTSLKSNPVADAGPDRTVPAGASGDTAVTLDGSGSYDPDGGPIVSYTWNVWQGGSLTGATPTIRLKTGIHKIILTVADDEGSTDNDTVIVTVMDTAYDRMPVITHAAFFSDNGRGSVDRVEIHYGGPLEIAQIPDSIRICWPDSGDCRMVRKAGIALDTSDSAHLTIAIPQPAFPEEITRYIGSNANLGRTYWKAPSTTDARTVESPFAIEDSVGPLIMNASVVERIKPGVDTLYVSFSEAIIPQTIVGPSLILVKNGVPSVIKVDTFREVSGGFYVINLDSGSVRPLPGDSLRINPSGPLRDQPGNPGHLLNRPVVLGTKGIPPSLLRAYYFDRDSGKADGVVDEAIVKFDKQADTAGLSLLFDWGWGMQTTIRGTDVTYLSADSTLVSVSLGNAFHGRPFPRTSGGMYVTSQWKQWKKVPWQTDQAQVEDSAGPVISSATYLPGGEDGGVCDTLVVSFSEPVAITPVQNAMPFKFLNGDDGSTYMLPVSLLTQASNDSTARFCVSPDPMVAMSKTGDSIWINPAGGVSDTGGMAQTNERNRRVPLKVNRPYSELAVRVLRNPFAPGTVVPNTDLIGTAVVVVRVNPKAKPPELTGSFRIYDLLGNLVFEGNAIKKDLPPPVNTCYCFGWEGRNRANRVVASGIYRMAIKYAVEGETPKEKWISIGVKR